MKSKKVYDIINEKIKINKDRIIKAIPFYKQQTYKDFTTYFASVTLNYLFDNVDDFYKYDLTDENIITYVKHSFKENDINV